MPADFFEVFGLPETLNLNPADLEKTYHRLSRKYHPDLFARRSPAEQMAALDQTALLNDAYRTLRHPVSRAEYVLARHNLDITGQSAPPELLEEVFELNMALEDSDAAQISAFHTRFSEMLAAIDRELEALFPQPAPDLAQIRTILNRRNYIRNLVNLCSKSTSASQTTS